MSQAQIPGWSALIEWFGHEPNFHDAEVISIDLRREPEPSVVRVHAWRTNADLDKNGCFRRDKQAIVTFTLEGITALELSDWNRQNVLFELHVESGEEGCTMHLPSSSGLEGKIIAASIVVSFEPGSPSGGG